MSKELYISSSPHETKIAVLEDDQLVEVYHERDVDVGLVGGIYKGRVSRVLPGMQSAFVNIGLDRDAFLYVSDFYEDEEEYDKVFTEAEARATRFVEGGPAAAVEAPAPEVAVEIPAPPPAPPAETAVASPAPPAPAPAAPAPETTGEPTSVAAPPPATKPVGETGDDRHRDQRGRRRRRHGRDFGERKFTPRPESHARPTEPPSSGAPHRFEILPGESLAKYRGAATGPASSETPAPVSTEPSAPEITPELVVARETETATGLAAPAENVEEVTSVDAGVPTMLPASAEESTTGFATAEIAPPPEPGFHADSESVAAQPVIEAPAVHEEAPASDIEATHVGVRLPTLPEGQVENRPFETTKPAEASVAQEAPEAPSAVEQAGPAVVAPEPSLELEPPALTPEAEEAGVTSDAARAGESVAEEDAVSAEAAPQAETDVDQAGTMPATSEAKPAEPAEKKVTLREPYQRPRFAPRRRRGRRGVDPRPRSEQQREPSRPGNHQPVQISDLLKEGQEILVQIAKEPLGTKGARITSHIALPGRYLVYMPTINHIGVSRKITSEDERLRLRNIILENKGSLTGGFIVRTAGGGRSEDEFKADLKFLSTLWTDIRNNAERTKAPALLHRDLDLVQRILRDTLSPDFKTVRVDNEIEYERCVDFVNRCQPSLVGNVKLYTKNAPLFEEFGIQTEIDKALKPKVWLKSGGYIVINQTEALVAIDVNTGKYVGKTNRLEDTIVKTNIDAVNEIVRQIRLRDLGGILVIDFIDMDERRNRQKVVQALEEALRRDRAPTKIIAFNDFGLVAITRKRVKQSLERTLCQPCSYCSGAGWIKSLASVCFEILGEVKKMAKTLEGDSVTLRVNPEVAHALKSRQGALLSEIEALTHKDVIIKSDPLVHQERFEIY